MITLQIEGLKELQATLKGFSERRLNAAVATGLTRTAVQVRDEVKTHMRKVFDRPTPYTMKQVNYAAATADKPSASVGFNVVAVTDIQGALIAFRDLGPGQTPAGKYLQFQTEGGQRKTKRFEKALQTVGAMPSGWRVVPGQRAKMDAYGNQSVGEIRQILSYFDAAELVAGSRQNMGPAGRAKRLAGTRRTSGWEYFIVPVGGRRAFVRAGGGSGSHKMQPGIYRRTNLALGSRIEPVMIFVSSASYRKRFDFYGLSARIVSQRLGTEIGKAIQEQIVRMGASASGPVA